MAAFKYAINKIDKCVSTMAELSQKQVKANNMKILETKMIFSRAMPMQCSQRNYDTKFDSTWTSPSTCIDEGR